MAAQRNDIRYSSEEFKEEVAIAIDKFLRYHKSPTDLVDLSIQLPDYGLKLCKHDIVRINTVTLKQKFEEDCAIYSFSGESKATYVDPASSIKHLSTGACAGFATISFQDGRVSIVDLTITAVPQPKLPGQ